MSSFNLAHANALFPTNHLRYKYLISLKQEILGCKSEYLCYLESGMVYLNLA